MSQNGEIEFCIITAFDSLCHTAPTLPLEKIEPEALNWQHGPDLHELNWHIDNHWARNRRINIWPDIEDQLIALDESSGGRSVDAEAEIDTIQVLEIKLKERKYKHKELSCWLEKLAKLSQKNKLIFLLLQHQKLRICCQNTGLSSKKSRLALNSEC